MNIINSQIKLVIDRLAGGNNSKFAVMVGTSETNIRNYTRDVQPKANFLLILATKFKVNVVWLLVGGPETEMFMKDELKEADLAIDTMDIYSKVDSNYKNKYIDALEQLIDAKNEIERLKDELVKNGNVLK